ncbi:hypothetical protein MCOR12_006459 [Pyricularia oryzae]|nr:hypothetical protein MCOR12_006459 [Pyricularia oryzae]
MLDPHIRAVGFDDESHIMTVVTHCRALWATDPAIEKTNGEGAGEQAAGNAAPNPFQFGSRLQLGEGHYHPPKHQVLSVPFTTSHNEDGTEGEAPAAVCKKWKTHMLLIPTFLATGVTTRATLHEQNDQERDLGIFDKSTAHKFELCYLCRSLTIRLYVEGENSQNNKIAAVMVLGELTAGMLVNRSGNPFHVFCSQSSVYDHQEVMEIVDRSP